jgi:hypothetical protein
MGSVPIRTSPGHRSGPQRAPTERQSQNVACTTEIAIHLEAAGGTGVKAIRQSLWHVGSAAGAQSMWMKTNSDTTH